jgi:hypothetical protein
LLGPRGEEKPIPKTRDLGHPLNIRPRHFHLLKAGRSPSTLWSR